MRKIERLQQAVAAALLGKINQAVIAHDELTLTVTPENLILVMQELKTNPELDFAQCVDVCGVDYLNYGEPDQFTGLRFAAVYHLLSLTYNWRIRVKSFAQNNDFPIIPSLEFLWNGLNWFEREAFDLYGIIFDGHPDLRRILTDYGFIGHPFRKDFPLSGYMEMRYDEEQKRVIYQAVTIEPREVTPRIIREEHYGGRN